MGLDVLADELVQRGPCSEPLFDFLGPGIDELLPDRPDGILDELLDLRGNLGPLLDGGVSVRFELSNCNLCGLKPFGDGA